MNRKSKKYVLFIIILFILFPILLAGNSSLIAAQKQPKIDSQVFRNDMRKFWEDHSELTRSFIISTLADLPDQSETAQQLIQNQNEIGAVIKPFYGDAVGDQLAALLKEHALIGAAMLQALRKADAAAFEESVARWYANADDIAQFLHDTNPENWPLRKTKPMLREYLDLTLEEALACWNGDYVRDIAAYDKVQDQALEIADMLSEGIINKFRVRFK
ncbi:MAG: glycosyltransferase [Anaerolineae bacterium]|nr:glycosyltransferase [Anaerolineae bacterium]MCI0607897.1 glycosyltransferase [Anaerolineae bacterium]